MATVRLNLMVDESVPDLLTQLAEGERKRGEYLSALILGMAQHRGPSIDDAETLALAMKALAGQVKVLTGKVAVLEAQYEMMQGD